MMPSRIIESAAQSGLRLSTDGNQILMEAAAPPPNDLLDQLKANKQAVMDDLANYQGLWLSRVASLIGWPLTRLMKENLLTHADAQQHWRTDPIHAAQALIKTFNLSPMAKPSGDAKCQHCAHFQRTSHPHLGHCAKGEPEPAAGLWDSDKRYCMEFEAGAHD